MPPAPFRHKGICNSWKTRPSVPATTGAASAAAAATLAQPEATLEMITHFQQLAEYEKASLARELHDELAGSLIGAVMDLSLLAPRRVMGIAKRKLVTGLPDSCQS